MLGNPILRQKAKKIHRFEPGLARLVEDMFATLHAADGLGLAAPQIAELIRLCVIAYDDPQTGRHHRLALANPEIVEAAGTQRGTDGCLSIPGYYGVNVRRAARVVVKAQDVRGKPQRVRAEGLLAWVLQHENDHLDGILYLDRLDSPDDLRVIRAEIPADAALPVE
jgi:peptide deformylase